MICAHVCDNELTINPTQPNGISQAARKVTLILAVWIHFEDACPDIFLFFAGIAATSDRNIDLIIRSKCDCACQMPTTVLIGEAIIGKCGENLRLARWFC